MLKKIAFCALICWMPLAAAVNYTYDAAGRLALVDYGNGTTIAYTYDNAGNLLTKTVTAPAAPSSASPDAKARQTTGSKKQAPKQ